MQLNPRIEDMTLRELKDAVAKDMEHLRAMNMNDIAALMDVQYNEQLEKGMLLRGKSSAAETKKAHKGNLKKLLSRCKKPDVKGAGRDDAMNEVQKDLATLKRWYELVKASWPLNAVYVEFKQANGNDDSSPRKRPRKRAQP